MSGSVCVDSPPSRSQSWPLCPQMSAGGMPPPPLQVPGEAREAGKVTPVSFPPPPHPPPSVLGPVGTIPFCGYSRIPANRGSGAGAGGSRREAEAEGRGKRERNKRQRHGERERRRGGRQRRWPTGNLEDPGRQDSGRGCVAPGSFWAPAALSAMPPCACGGDVAQSHYVRSLKKYPKRCESEHICWFWRPGALIPASHTGCLKKKTQKTQNP